MKSAIRLMTVTEFWRCMNAGTAALQNWRYTDDVASGNGFRLWRCELMKLEFTVIIEEPIFHQF
jgi:hypothetical protein